MKRLSLILSRNQLFTIYKTFLRSHLEYADIIYDKLFNDSFLEKLEKVQYSAVFITSRAVKGTSQKRFYQELGLESLCDRRWYHKLVFFYNIVKGLILSYLQSYFLLDNERTYNTRSSLKIR